MKKLPKAQLGAIIKYGIKGVKTGAKIGARATQKNKALTVRAKKLNNLDKKYPGTWLRLAMMPKNNNSTLIKKASKLRTKKDDRDFYKAVIGGTAIGTAAADALEKSIRKKKK